MTERNDEFGARTRLECSGGSGVLYRIQKLAEDGIAEVSRLPYSIKILLEAALRQCDGFEITREDVERIARWSPETAGKEEIPFKPARVVMQDFTGVPAVVDLAVMRDAVADLGGDPEKVNPLIPVDLVIDHSVQVDYYGIREALAMNAAREFERNRERYEFLRWGQESFDNFRVVPPATGIVHQVNLEYLAQVVQEQDGEFYPDSLVGTDSHTTMINGLGVLGWGVGGIEAEAVMLGQPIYMLLPQVVGVKLTGALPTGTTATDLVLTVVQMLRAHGVVGKFVEFYGPGLSELSLADRATLANMAPEYGRRWAFSRLTRRRWRIWRSPGARRRWSSGSAPTWKRRACSTTPRLLIPSSASTWRWIWVRSSRAWPARRGPRIGSRSRTCRPPLPPRWWTALRWRIAVKRSPSNWASRVRLS